MAHFTREALSFLSSHHGVATASQLEAHGLTTHQIRSLREVGSLERVADGVYRMPAVPLDELGRCAAICARHPDAVIAGVTAGRLWGFRRLAPDRRVHIITAPAAQRCCETWLVAYRTAAIHDVDRIDRGDGIVVTSRARTALDLGRVLGRADLLSVIEQAMAEGGASDADMRRVAVDWMSSQRPWVRTFLELLDGRLYGGGAESHLEVRLGDALRHLPGLVRQFRIDLPGYGPARFDLAFPELRWAIEVDGFPTHRETAGRARDELRDRASASIGWSVTRLDPHALGPGFADTAARLIAEHATRLRAMRNRAHTSRDFSPPRDTGPG